MAAKPIKVKLEITLKKGEGQRQDEDTVIQRLIEDIEGMDDVYVQDENHDDETPYKVHEVEQVS